MELTQAILKRRSIRKFTDYVVTDAEIAELLEAARWAPSWANTQCCEFIVVRDRGLIEKITAAYSEFNPARKCSLAASALIIGCAHSKKAGVKEGGWATKFSSWYMFDLGLAVQTICLRAHELGLGTVIVGLMNHDICKDLLGLPEDYEVVVSIPIGKPAVEAKEGPARRAVAEFTHLDRFGNPFMS